MSHNPQPETVVETAFAMKVHAAKEDANVTEFVHVDYTDLEHFIENCRRKKDEESFNTAIRILQAIKQQVTGK
jgi:hypothetical protein